MGLIRAWELFGNQFPKAEGRGARNPAQGREKG